MACTDNVREYIMKGGGGGGTGVFRCACHNLCFSRLDNPQDIGVHALPVDRNI